MIHSNERAKKHTIMLDKPAVRFMEGALLGNGALGVVVCTRPDAIVLHLGHNNVWDIRLAEKNKAEIGTFNDVFNKINELFKNNISLMENKWFIDYCKMTRENYSHPYPRPFPCGSVILKFDRRKYELIGHELDISNGLCRVKMVCESGVLYTEIFVQYDEDKVWLRCVDAHAQNCDSPFNEIYLMPDPTTPDDIPSYEVDNDRWDDRLCFRQVMPFDESALYDIKTGNPKDKAFSVCVKSNIRIENKKRSDVTRSREDINRLERVLSESATFNACIKIDEGMACNIKFASDDMPEINSDKFNLILAKNTDIWKEYWNRSGTSLEDEMLESVWYRNLYFFNCSVKEGTTCPGLFANWSYKKIGSEWHGDYHMNYNTQQPFWMCFSTNHLDKHLPYVELVNNLLPVSKKWANKYYETSGAFFPHSAYPVEMSMNSYPEPGMAWEISETPFTVQSIWWHYLYSMDVNFLKNHGYEPMKQAVIFLVEYMTRSDAHGDRWGDDKYHIFPTMVPELYGITNDYMKNYDCITDLTLTKFVFNAFIDCCSILGTNETEHLLIEKIKDVLLKFPDYPCTNVENGKIFTCVPQEQGEVIYNCPVSTMTVFPGEEHGLHSSHDEYTIALNTYKNQQNEGGNDLVFLNLQGARLGALDLDKFKRQINYCLMPNGTCTDMVLQVKGRYFDDNDFDWMAQMGIWFENFSLPLVINECLLQSYTGVLRFFPNWPKGKHAEFSTFRTVGAFLVSSAFKEEVEWIEVYSETGSILRMINPWHGDLVCTTNGFEQIFSGVEIAIPTEKNQTLIIKKQTNNIN